MVHNWVLYPGFICWGISSSGVSGQTKVQTFWKKYIKIIWTQTQGARSSSSVLLKVNWCRQFEISTFMHFMNEDHLLKSTEIPKLVSWNSVNLNQVSLSWQFFMSWRSSEVHHSWTCFYIQLIVVCPDPMWYSMGTVGDWYYNWEDNV